MTTETQHSKDSDCTVDPATNLCTVCGVDHGDPCPRCNGKGFHTPDCPDSDANLDAAIIPHSREWYELRDAGRPTDTAEERTRIGNTPAAEQPLTLVELLDKANEGYPDGFLTTFYDQGTGAEIEGSGDTLAQFVVRELRDTFDAESSEEAQIQAAVETLEHAIRDIQATIDALEG